jgi:UDP-GlcNAc:undecaprenyl-phosphate GlcNAc-1-phosphate transferase
MSVVAAVIAACIAAILCACLTPMVTWLAARYGLYDAPDGQRRVHEEPVPRLGGVAIVVAAIAVAVPALTPVPLSETEARFWAGFLSGTGILLVVGIVDDIRGVPPLMKLAAQIAAAVAVLLGGLRPEQLAIAYGSNIEIGWLFVPLVVLWVVAATNAYNLIDGLNGLAVGVAITACVGAAAGSLSSGQTTVLIAVAALGGALVGFLPFNFPKARIFLGDSGSMAVGFMLAVLLLRASTQPETGAVALAIPVAALFLPFLDTALAIIRRWLRDVPFAGADARHIHHRLVAVGLSQQKATVMLWALATLMMVLGVVISLSPPIIAGVTVLLGAAAIVVLVIHGTSLLSYHELLVAGDVLVSGPGRARRLITDQIAAMDVCQSIDGVTSIKAMNALLAGSAARFGFVVLEVRADGQLEPRLADARALSCRRYWRVDYPLYPESSRHVDYSLSIWCDAESSRPFGAERVARVLAPALERWLATAPEEEPSLRQAVGRGATVERVVTARPQNDGERPSVVMGLSRLDDQKTPESSDSAFAPTAASVHGAMTQRRREARD